MVASKRRGRRTGKVTFLAHLEGIKKMLDAGHTMISVFEEYESRLSIKSGQFGKYVRKFIRRKQDGDSDRAGEKGKNIKKKSPIRAREPGQPAFVSSDEPRSKDELC